MEGTQLITKCNAYNAIPNQYFSMQGISESLGNWQRGSLCCMSKEMFRTDLVRTPCRSIMHLPLEL